MTCLVSTSFAFPVRISLPRPPPPIKEVQRLESSLVRFSSSETVTAGYILFSAQKTLVACSSNRHILSVKGRFQHCFMSCTRFIYESFSYNMNNVQCMEIFLCGYWVGPDDDDGWGFVEAVINQIT
ncbi:uncharacterized protein LOC107617340 [Arachis ipaensis]|nr:uncharacterized protein LOC107617340 [Arachis ipaensis]XP_025679862.1 uncharacterized protein LOC112779738 [Arachis hypogaea]